MNFCSYVYPSMVQEIHLSDQCEQLPCAAKIILTDGRDKLVSLESSTFRALQKELSDKMSIVPDEGCGICAKKVQIEGTYTGKLTAEIVLTRIFNDTKE